MQDYFLKLGLSPGTSNAEIEAAIKVKPKLAAAAEILLNDHRRAAYQRTVFTVRSIGILRHRLGLDNDNNWFVETCPDFVPRLHSRKSANVADAATSPAAPAADRANDTPAGGERVTPVTPSAGENALQNRGWLKPVIIVLAIAAILILLMVVL